MDSQVLSQLSRFVEFEADISWIGVPIDVDQARALGLNRHWEVALSGVKTLEERVRLLWNPVKDLLPRSFAVFSANLYGIALLTTRASGVSLVYCFREGSDLAVRRGYAPTITLPQVARAFPVRLEDFYGVHDGLVNFMSFDGGPLPTNLWRTAVDADSGERSLVKVATDGSEAFGFDVSEQPCRAYVVRPDDDEVEEVADAWAFLDDLLASRLEE